MIKLVAVKLAAPLPDPAAYRPFALRRMAAIQRMARTLEGMKIVHVSATARGGGVAELLKSQTALENAVGLDSRWFTFRAPRRFFAVTKKLHNLLQGKPGTLSKAELAVWRETSWAVGRKLSNALRTLRPAVVVIHDPQPLYLVTDVPRSVRTILRLHLDLSAPNPEALAIIRPLLGGYRRIVVSHPSYRLPGTAVPTDVIMPAIDPLSEKNRPMARETALSVLAASGVALNPADPLIAQVSRFDPWKNPLGVIRAYYLAKTLIPNLQLILAGSQADDDPESTAVFAEIKKHCAGDRDLFLINQSGQRASVSGDLLISAVYTAATAVMQNSIREGFGLTITEAMWKGKAVIAGNAAGARLQIANGKNAFISRSPQASARLIVRLVENVKLRERLGRAAHASVRKKFLFPRYLADHLTLYRKLRAPSRPA